MTCSKMKLFDFIPHLTCTHYSDVNNINYCQGGTVTRQILPRILMPISNPNVDKNFKKKCATFEGFDKGKHWLIIPDIDISHYNVNDVMIDNKSKTFITKVLKYDSLTKLATRFTTKKTTSPQITEFIANLVGVFNKFCLNPKKQSCQLKEVLQHVMQMGCPRQRNEIDSGLIAVMNCLHSVDGVPINELIFTQQHITTL